MKCHINTGFGDAFTDVHTIYEAAQTSLPNQEMLDLNLTPTLTIPAGDTLHVRVLPWHEHTSGSGKYLLLRNVTIEGQAFAIEEEGIDNVQGDKGQCTKVLREGMMMILRNGRYYDMTGQLIR